MKGLDRQIGAPLDDDRGAVPVARVSLSGIDQETRIAVACEQSRLNGATVPEAVESLVRLRTAAAALHAIK